MRMFPTDPMFGVSFANFRNSERHVGQLEETNSNKEGLLKVSYFATSSLIEEIFWVIGGTPFGKTSILED